MHRPPLPPVDIPGTHLYQRQSRLQGQGVARRINSMKNPNETIGTRTRDLPACSAVPQQTAPLYTPISVMKCMSKDLEGQSTALLKG